MFTRDITERKIAEAKILQSLKEKEVLLKEIHHRVKNNLQIISSILSLQANFIKDKKSAEMVRDIQGRIKSMSVIHDLLYQSKNFNNINFAEYLEIVIVNITHSFSPIERTKKELNAPALDLKIENLYLDLEVAIPCGLIVNELITNSIKYAFSTQKKPVIHLSLKKEKNLITLIVQDNGKGLPPKLDIRNSKSLGLQLVTSLVEQLDGKLKVESKTGAKFTITFSIK
jgi:two-component sensor histidine kinase